MSKYGNTEISFAKSPSFDFSVQTKYGHFDYDEYDLEIIEKYIEKTYKKYIGKRQGENKRKGQVNIESSFGKVNFLSIKTWKCYSNI